MEKNTPDKYCDEWSVGYDTRLLDPNSLVSYGPFTAMLVWNVFFPILPKFLFVIIVIYAHFIDILQSSVKRIYGVVRYVIITLLQIVCRVHKLRI